MCLVRLINPKYLPEVVILCLVISLAYYCAKEDSAPEELEDIPVSYAQHPYTKLSFHDKFMAMYTLKPGVKADNLISAMDTAAVKIAHCYRHVLEDYDYRPLVTSANDSRHSSRRSYHYRNAALDIRIRDLRWKERSQIMQCVHDSLDESRFYIRHEAIGTPLEHLHVHCFKY
jgi:hypothetical protein